MSSQAPMASSDLIPGTHACTPLSGTTSQPLETERPCVGAWVRARCGPCTGGCKLESRGCRPLRLLGKAWQGMARHGKARRGWQGTGHGAWGMGHGKAMMSYHVTILGMN